jgi:hypothetical protein
MNPNRGGEAATSHREVFTPQTLDRRVWLSASAAVLVRPWLWSTAVRQLVRMARPGWWRRAPFLPLPDPDYARFRLETAYGPDGAPRREDLVSYLEWCRRAG